ncbi:cell wall hydrolase [Novosphingobium aerophilum]|uniref:cell wall hydrolase n=1 Tax=Novosphingobium TaxID=165696 RepID=UPI0025CCFDB4|nr:MULTISPECIES: cell wall hydrolase [unclassified Novosphingobium]WRT92473.1 cell wall hydrolase [Novosphingobium sp. RL4]
MTAAALPACLEPWEARPRDFRGHFARGGRRHVARRARRRWSLGFAALAAVALPAFASPGSWQQFSIADARSPEQTVLPMPFEQAGASFPGSAFYYLDAEEPVLRIGEGIHSDADDGVTGPGPVARALRIDNSGVDRSRALQCLTAAIYYEAASEPDAGQRAVAQVVLNRLAHPAYPKTVCGVVYQGSERSTGCQFSFTCDGSLARAPQRFFWQRAQEVARAALSGYVYAPVGLATHYHTVQVNPYWAPSLHYLSTIGAHRFYALSGPAGSPSAFRFAYFGGEPLAAPHRHDDSAASAVANAALDPLAVQRAFEAATPIRPDTAIQPASAPATLVQAAVPAYASDVRERGGEALYRARNLPEAHGIRPEYANSGRWIGQPVQ